jgi:Protein kinase domain
MFRCSARTGFLGWTVPSMKRVRLLCLLILVSLLALPTWSESTELLIETDPQGALLVDQYGNEVGQSGETFFLDLKPYGSTLELTLVLEGYESKVERIKTRPLARERRYPPKGAIALRPTSLWVSFKGFLTQNPGLASAATLLLLGGAVWTGLRRRTMQARLVRAQFLEKAMARAQELDDSLLGTQLGAYRLTDHLGDGGTARVYRAVPDASLDESQAVAIKVLHSDTENDNEFQARFRREVNIWKALRHPHIVSFIDWDEQDGITYLVMELVEGTTMRPEFSQGPHSPKQALQLLSPVFQAVAYAHEKGIAHRDLKPENVLVTPAGKSKVTDFGLARVGSEDKVTKTGTWVGTPEYISPEQVRGLGVDPRTDQYALGIMLYELVHGEPPFTGEDQVALIFKQVSSKPASLKALHPDLPQEFCDHVGRMLAKNPEDRFRDLTQALAHLESSCV